MGASREAGLLDYAFRRAAVEELRGARRVRQMVGAPVPTRRLRSDAEVMAEQVLAAGRLQVPVGSDPGVTQRPRRRWGGAPQCGPIGGVDYVTELRLTQNTIREPSPSVRFQR